MGNFVIFCAGDFSDLAEPIESEDFLLAADGGFRHFARLHCKPHGALGDFDSLGYIPEGARVFPVEKDDTDSMLAARQGLAMGYRRFVLYGALDGPRLDHTVANFQVLQFLAEHGAVGYLVGSSYIAAVFRQETVTFPADWSGVISLFCLGSDADGVTLRGLKYPLENWRLTSGYPLGVSNHFLGREASVTVAQGSLLALWDRKNGLPKNR